MISLSTATVLLVRKTKQLIGAVVVHEMRKSAASYGLYNDNLFPDRKSTQPINLHLNKPKLRTPRH